MARTADSLCCPSVASLALGIGIRSLRAYAERTRDAHTQFDSRSVLNLSRITAHLQQDVAQEDASSCGRECNTKIVDDLLSIGGRLATRHELKLKNGYSHAAEREQEPEIVTDLRKV